MQKELTCEQVGAIITFYMEGKLSDTLQKAVKHHLDICPECRAKFDELKKMVERFSNKEFGSSIDDDIQNKFKKKQYAEFKSNLSAYIDNELDDRENIRIKKITISNPMARRDLEEMYAFKKLLHSSFEKTKNEIRHDFSRNVLNQMYSQPKETQNSFRKLVIAFCIMFSAIIIGAVELWVLNS